MEVTVPQVAQLKNKLDKVLLPTRLAIGNRRFTRCNIVVHGDSTDEGVGVSSNDRLRAYPHRLGVSLRDRYAATPEIADSQHPNFLPACAPGAMHTASPSSWFGTAAPPSGWSVDTSRGPNGYALKADAAGSTLTLSIPANVSLTTLQLVSRRGPDASYGYTVTLNGGASTATTPTGTLKDGCYSAIQNVTGSVANTLVITAGGANTIVEGVVMYGNNYNRGIVVYNIARGGSRAYDWLPASRGGKDWIRANQSPTVDAGVQSLIDMNPDLIIRGGIYNDVRFSTGRSPEQYKQDEIDLLAGMRSVLPAKEIPVILLSKWKPADTFLADAVSYNRVWEHYLTARDEIAAQDPNTVHVNLESIFPRPLSTEASRMAATYLDNVHGGDRIYGAVGDILADLIGGRSPV